MRSIVFETDRKSRLHVYGRDETWGGGARPRQISRGFGQKDTLWRDKDLAWACESRSQNQNHAQRD